MATKHTLDQIRKDIEKHVGKNVVLRANKGRKKMIVRRGILENTYPSIFVVKIDDSNCTRVSYSYSDVLTSTVKLQICTKENMNENMSENMSVS